MEITRCEIRAVGRLFQKFPSESLFHISCNLGHMWSGIVVPQQDTFREQSWLFSAKYPVQPVTITVSIHGHSTRMEINQQETLVIPKYCGHNFLRGWHCFELLMDEDEGCLHDIDAFFISGVTSSTHASSPVTKQSRKETPSA
ncbi:hypothetical protein AVEN_138052-1 [Araneus ventricosus]|uniref:Uncharacterized protein n=1 Tax=Araneus ventricosus TaxID=182803 RepID=A0A4Y2SE31_ARAVE|nr:hypothetical protein AVEN_138052-1 [Araneus ventricosus]